MQTYMYIHIMYICLHMYVGHVYIHMCSCMSAYINILIVISVCKYTLIIHAHVCTSSTSTYILAHIHHRYINICTIMYDSMYTCKGVCMYTIYRFMHRCLHPSIHPSIQIYIHLNLHPFIHTYRPMYLCLHACTDYAFLSPYIHATIYMDASICTYKCM